MYTRRQRDKLTDFTCRLPSDTVLREGLNKYKTSHDLVIHFFILRNRSDLLGKCLKARFGGGGGNPSEQAFKRGEIDEYERDVVWVLTDCYQSIFTLIQMNWEDIKSLKDIFPDFEFTDEREMFLKILKEHFDGAFLNSVDGYTFTPSHALQRAKILEVMNTALKFNQPLVMVSQNDRKSLGLEKSNKYFQWLPIVLEIGKENSLKKPNLAVYYRDCWSKLKLLAEVHEYWTNKHRQLPARAVKWEDGKLFVGSVGGYQSVTKVNQSFGNFSKR